MSSAPAEAVEAAAKAEYEHEFLMLEGVWEQVPDHVKALFRQSAKVALEAAAPHLQAAAWEAGMRHALTWLGLKQYGDVMAKDNPYGKAGQ